VTYEDDRPADSGDRLADGARVIVEVAERFGAVAVPRQSTATASSPR
jgi:hypothetical protein